MKLNQNIRILTLTLCLLLSAFPVAAVERPFTFYGKGQMTMITDGAGNIIGADFTAAGRKLGAGMDATLAGGAIRPGLWGVIGALQFAPDPNNGRRGNLGDEIPTRQAAALQAPKCKPRCTIGEEIPTLQGTSALLTPNLLLTSGATTITAANGDRLQAVIDGVLDVATGIAKGSFQFVGGTGQFTQVSGTAHFVVEQNRATGAFEMSVVGSINF